jgi:chemotaxis protein methyltransferase CheR
MGRLSLRPVAYRHVVFPDWAGSGPVVNFAPQHADVITRPVTPFRPNLSDEEASVLRWLFEQAELQLDHYRGETLKRRIPAFLRALRAESVSQVRHLVQRNPPLLKLALSSLIIGITSFFRDPAVFTALSDRVLPELLSRGSGPRIWSAGCSDGSELYSVALLMAEKQALHRCCLLGTDCRADAVARAREGRYETSAIKGVPAELLWRYFGNDGGGWRLQGGLRTCIQWRTADVLSVREPGAWDMILCRNLAIYLHPPAAARLWAHLEENLRPGGYLVLGKAERPSGTKWLQPVGLCLYRREA